MGLIETRTGGSSPTQSEPIGSAIVRMRDLTGARPSCRTLQTPRAIRTFATSRMTPRHRRAPRSPGNVPVRNLKIQMKKIRKNPISKSGTNPRRTDRATGLARETVQQWATRVLLHAHAIRACPECSYMKLNFSFHGLDYAHALAEHDPYPRLSKAQCIEAVDSVFDSLGDDCPACD